MSTYDWFGPHLKDNGLDQGLILPDFPIPNFSKVNYNLLASDEDVDLPVEINTGDLIIMTQACDLENDKVDNVTLCRVYPLNEYIIVSGLSKTKTKELVDRLNSNQVMNMALLDKPNLNPYGGAFEDYLLVKFDESVNYPINLIKQRVEGEQGEMLKLLPPYREALSQNYGVFFMRVGNPENRAKVYPEYYYDFLDPVA